jgi:hypothetical protein
VNSFGAASTAPSTFIGSTTSTSDSALTASNKTHLWRRRKEFRQFRSGFIVRIIFIQNFGNHHIGPFATQSGEGLAE